LLSRPLYIHLDLSESGDKTGIAGTWIMGKKPHQEGVPDSKELYYRLAFHCSVKAPKGHNISFEKNRQFIYWLREQGFAIKGVSTDTFQSFDTGQMLTAKGFNYETISVDRVDADHICKPYLTLKNAIYEERLEIYESKLLTEELIGLERNNNGKIDHGPSGINSKDSADALCGSIYNASKHAEEFAFEYGEDLETTIEVSSAKTYLDQKQIEIELEQMLNELHDPLKDIAKEQTQKDLRSQGFLNFGMGAAQQLRGNDPFYISNGIII